jgi:hypothetical protein
MTAKPNNDPWVNGMLEHMGEDPQQEKMDSYVPDEWFELPDFQFARRIVDIENIDEVLAEYDNNPYLTAQYRSIDIGETTLHYMLVFLRRSDETS